MRHALLLPLLALAAGPVWATDPAVRLPPLPTGPVIPPTPMPGADAVTRLTPDLLFVFDADAPALVLVSPAGRARVVQSDGPLRIKGRFADEPQKVQTRTFAGKVVYEVEVLGDGPCELLVVPAGATATDQVLRRQLLCDTGHDPPPPTPDPQPQPKPPGPVNPAGPVAFLVVVEETADAVAGRGAFFADTALAARMKARGLRWRVVDKDVVGADGKPPADVARFLTAAAGKPYPSLFLVDAAGKLIDHRPVPRTPADLLALLTQFGG